MIVQYMWNGFDNNYNAHAPIPYHDIGLRNRKTLVNASARLGLRCLKLACVSCMSGHRGNSCCHIDEPLMFIRERGHQQNRLVSSFVLFVDPSQPLTFFKDYVPENCPATGKNAFLCPYTCRKCPDLRVVIITNRLLSFTLYNTQAMHIVPSFVVEPVVYMGSFTDRLTYRRAQMALMGIEDNNYYQKCAEDELTEKKEEPVIAYLKNAANCDLREYEIKHEEILSEARLSLKGRGKPKRAKPIQLMKKSYPSTILDQFKPHKISTADKEFFLKPAMIRRDIRRKAGGADPGSSGEEYDQDTGVALQDLVMMDADDEGDEEEDDDESHAVQALLALKQQFTSPSDVALKGFWAPRPAKMTYIREEYYTDAEKREMSSLCRFEDSDTEMGSYTLKPDTEVIQHDDKYKYTFPRLSKQREIEQMKETMKHSGLNVNMRPQPLILAKFIDPQLRDRNTTI